MWHSRARSGLRMACWDGEGRGCQGMCLCMATYLGKVWDCVTVTLFGCVNLGRSRSRSRSRNKSKSENASSNSSSPSQLPSDGNPLD